MESGRSPLHAQALRGRWALEEEKRAPATPPLLRNDFAGWKSSSGTGKTRDREIPSGNGPGKGEDLLLGISIAVLGLGGREGGRGARKSTAGSTKSRECHVDECCRGEDSVLILPTSPPPPPPKKNPD